nr:EOG090X07PD [Ilyocryptus agilis]
MASELKKTSDLPGEISVLRFANARKEEILALTSAIENPNNTRLIFQKLPCHMRRRAMSHNPKRMPRRLREAHKSQMGKSGQLVMSKPKRPRRKFRRRPSRLLEEYKKRSNNFTWLETHIWHAKRFHMTIKWGYHLPDRSCARSHRFCYRSLSNHCMLLDISYMRCIELRGSQNDILKGLGPLCDTSLGITFASAAFLKGSHEGSVLVFKRGDFSSGPIGLVRFLWRCGDMPDMRSIWLWSHAAFYDQLLNELRAVFADEPTTVMIFPIKENLSRFRLRGPKAYNVVSCLLDERDKQLLGPHLPPACIIKVDVRDPRTVVRENFSSTRESSNESLVNSGCSDLWDENVRDEINKLKNEITDQVINQRRSQQLVPGTNLPISSDERLIPIIIINAHNEGERFFPGCDIILPSGWARAFWVALSHGGGHAGGLKDVASMNYEHKICRDLCLEIDSDAGKTDAEEHMIQLKEEYFCRPPKTRTNFIKLATPFPFGVDWRQLLADWTADREVASFTVLRNRKLLQSCSLKNPPLLSDPYLLPVTVRVEHGCPHEFAMISVAAYKEKMRSLEINKVNCLISAASSSEPLYFVSNSTISSVVTFLKSSLQYSSQFISPFIKSSSSTAPAVTITQKNMKLLSIPNTSYSDKNSGIRCVIGYQTCHPFSSSSPLRNLYELLAFAFLKLIMNNKTNAIFVDENVKNCVVKCLNGVLYDKPILLEEEIFKYLLTPPQYTIVRVNGTTKDAGKLLKELLMNCLQNQYCFKGLHCPSIEFHPKVDDVLVIKSNCIPCEVKAEYPNVIVGLQCGEAVLRGSQVYAPGVTAIPLGVYDCIFLIFALNVS